MSQDPSPQMAVGDAHRAATAIHLDNSPIYAEMARSIADPEGHVLALHSEGRLGYIKPSDEWTDGAHPLPDRLQAVAHTLVQAGRLPADTYAIEVTTCPTA